MEDPREALGSEQVADELVIGDRALDEPGALIDVFGEAAAQVVEDDHLVAVVEQRGRDVGADEPGAAGHERSGHGLTPQARLRRAMALRTAAIANFAPIAR